MQFLVVNRVYFGKMLCYNLIVIVVTYRHINMIKKLINLVDGVGRYSGVMRSMGET